MVKRIFFSLCRLSLPELILPAKLAVLLAFCTFSASPGQAVRADSQAVTKARASGPANAKSGAASRVISLAPSNTELIYSLGMEPRLVGVCNNCNFPQAAKNITRVGSFTSVSAEKLAGLKPDLVVLVDGQEKLAFDLASRHNVATVILSNSKLEYIGANLLKLGAFAGLTDKSACLKRKFEERLQRLREITCGKGVAPVSVFYCVWMQPLLTVGKGSYLNEAISACGGKNIAAALPAAYPHYNLERLFLSAPQFIVLPYEASRDNWQQRNIWRDLPAIKNKRFAILPPTGEDRLSRPTLRLLAGLHWLALQLHPELKTALMGWWDETKQTFPDLK